MSSGDVSAGGRRRGAARGAPLGIDQAPVTFGLLVLLQRLCSLEN